MPLYTRKCSAIRVDAIQNISADGRNDPIRALWRKLLRKAGIAALVFAVGGCACREPAEGTTEGFVTAASIALPAHRSRAARPTHYRNVGHRRPPVKRDASPSQMILDLYLTEPHGE